MTHKIIRPRLALAIFVCAFSALQSQKEGCREDIARGQTIIRFKNLEKYLAHMQADPMKVDELVKLVHVPTEKELCFGSWQECGQAVKKLNVLYDPEDEIEESTYLRRVSCYSETGREEEYLANLTSSQ